MAIFSRKKKESQQEAQEKQLKQYFTMLNMYEPAFSTFEGGMYEMALTRAAVHTFASHCSKLKIEVNGSGNEALERRLQFRPNPNMNSSQFLYKLATLSEVDNTAFIVPLYDKTGTVLSGFYPLKIQTAQVVDFDGERFLRYQTNGTFRAIELEHVGIVNKMNYDSDFFGKTNEPLDPTLRLLDANNQAIVAGVKNSANIRFLAKLAMTLSPDDMEAERERLVAENMKAENNNGVLLFDQKYDDIKQVQQSQFTVDTKQQELINENVFEYFGVNKDILENSFTSEQWAAYYEGKIEPWAIQVSQVLTNMTFTDKAQSYGNEIMLTSNRLEYLSPSEKLQTVVQLIDRGMLSLNEGREIFNMEGFGESGDRRYIRKEYANADDIDSINMEENVNE